MNERIKMLRMSKGLTQQEFADRLKVSRSNIANYENGNRAPVDAMVSLICKEFNVNEDWLRYGKEPMRLALSRDEEIEEMVNSAMRGSNEFKKAVIRMICSRTDNELQKLDEMLRAIYDNLPQSEELPSDNKKLAVARSGDRVDVSQVSDEEEEAALPPSYTGDI